MIISKTPYRLSLFGGGTDYPAWFENNPSKVIAAAMANYCYIAVKKLPPFFEHKNVVSYSKIEKINSFNDIEHPSIKACLKEMRVPEGITVYYDGDLPARSGIGSSSSFTVGLLNSLHAFMNKPITKDELAKKAIHIEQNVIGENVGIQDQILATYGGVQLISMGPGNKWNTSPLDFFFSRDYKNHFESHVMLGFSGVSRFAENQAKKKVDNIKNGLNFSLLSQMNSITEEALLLFSTQSEMKNIGHLMQENWLLKRNLAQGVTEKWIDDIYNKAIKNGAYGGKLMGAGGGGFFLFLVPPEKQESFKNTLHEIKVWVPFKLDSNGSQIMKNFG